MTRTERKPKWQTKPLNEVADIERQPVAPEQIASGTKYVGLEHITNAGDFVGVTKVSNGELASTKFRFGKQHILYGKLRPYLSKIARPDFEGVCSTDILPILPRKEVDGAFLFYYLRQPRMVELATRRSIGANLPRLSPKQLAQFEISFPPLAEQKRIADILDKADAIRRKRHGTLAEADELLKSTFQDMFHDWLGSPTSEMSSLGHPDMAEIVSGVTKGRRFNGKETVVVPYIRVANVQDGFLDLSEIKTIEVLPADVDNLLLQHGDVLMTEGGDHDKLGRGAMWEVDIPNCIHQNHVFRIRCNRDNLLPEYFAGYIQTTLAKAYFLRCAKKTSNLASINMTQLKATPVPCPPTELQRKFADIRRAQQKATATKERALAESDDLFNSLVQRAFKGGVVMRFQHYDLGHLSGGEIVQVNLSGTAANVLLLDSSNFSSYKSGRRYRYYGGHAKRSPVRIPVPRSGHWHIAIDLGGYRGTIRSSVDVLPGALKPIQEAPLSTVPSLVQHDEAPDGEEEVHREFDVFISHASEDRDEVVRPLATALKDGGLNVWYDEFELRIGDSLRRKIDKGLANSRFGVVVLSRAFFGKGWPNYELDGIVTRAVSGEQVILPIWHNISKSEVIEYSPSLADKLARNTTTHTVTEIAEEIIDVIVAAKGGCDG